MSVNLLANADFTLGDNGAPQSWAPDTPRPPLRPGFAWSPGALTVQGNGVEYGWGYWRQTVPVTGGRTYSLKVRFQIDGIDDVNLHVLNMVSWRRKGRSHGPMDHVSHFWRDGDHIVGEDVFEVPEDVEAGEVMLGLRYAPQGRVTWGEVKLAEAPPLAPRPVRVAAAKWKAPWGNTLESNLACVETLLDQAGALGSDLVLLPEFVAHQMSTPPAQMAEAVPGGPTTQLLARKAKEYGMYVSLSLPERDGALIFNTAVIFDRSGELVGTYRKTHPYWPEAMWDGVSPGDSFPVFDLDFGTVGIVTCYDSWYAETSRLLALKGAEVILLPNAGYEPLLIPARAIDNRVYVVVSSAHNKAMIVDTLGQTRAETYEGLITATVDLSRRPTPHANAGGTLNASAGGRRALRHAKSDRLYREILKEISTWEDRPDRFTWLPK